MASGRTTLVSEKLAPIVGPYSYGVKAGDWVFASGLMGVDAHGALLGETQGHADVEAQTRRALQNLSLVLDELGASSNELAKVQAYITDLRYLERYNETYAGFLKPPYPASAIHNKGLCRADAVIEIDGIATVSGETTAVRSTELAESTNPCAQAGTLANDVFFSTGHLSLDAHGKLVGRGDLRAQTEQALDNLGLALAAAGLRFSDVVMVNATVPDWFGYQAYNEIFLKYFREPFEARATIQGGLQTEGCLIEFEAVAAKAASKRFVESEVAGAGHFAVKRRGDTLYLANLPPARAPHSHAVQTGQLVYLCGQIPFDACGRLVAPGEIRAQTRKVMENHQLCMQALGGNLDDIIRTRVSITDPRLVEAFDEEYAAFFSPPFPARTLVVTGLPQERMVLEVEAIAILGASENSVSLVGPVA